MERVDVDAILEQVQEALAGEDWDRAVALVAARVVAGDLTVPPAAMLAFDRHSDVAPLLGGLPSPNGEFDVGDATVILRLASEESL